MALFITSDDFDERFVHLERFIEEKFHQFSEHFDRRMEKNMADLTQALADLDTEITAVLDEVTQLQAAASNSNDSAVQAAADAIEERVQKIKDALAPAQAADPGTPTDGSTGTDAPSGAPVDGSAPVDTSGTDAGSIVDPGTIQQ